MGVGMAGLLVVLLKMLFDGSTKVHHTMGIKFNTVFLSTRATYKGSHVVLTVRIKESFAWVVLNGA